MIFAEVFPIRREFGLLLLASIPAFFGGLVEDITKKVSETELRNGANAQVSLIAAKLLKKDDQVFEEQWTFAIDSKQAEYLVKLRKSEIGGMDFMLQKLK